MTTSTSPERSPAADRATTMRALIQDRYGPPDVLRIARVPVSAPEAGQVLVRVHAASVNARDWHIMRGEPRLARLLDRSIFARTGPRNPIRGTDFAGVVEEVGPGVALWRPGDAVYGEALGTAGTFAEYTIAAADSIAAIPAGVTFPQAAATPLAATTALRCLRAGHAEPGQRVLINGAAGGVGTFAIQLAAWLGLRVTAVCSTRNTELARSLGAHQVIDYQQQDFRHAGRGNDVVIDLVGNRSLGDLRAVLRPGGHLVLSGGGVPGRGRILGPLGLLLRAQLAATLTRTPISTPKATPDAGTLTELAQLIATGMITPVVDRTFDLTDAAAAVDYLETHHARAKVVINGHG